MCVKLQLDSRVGTGIQKGTIWWMYVSFAKFNGIKCVEPLEYGNCHRSHNYGLGEQEG